MKKIGIIGAGAAGICAIKHSLNNGVTPIAWELNALIGGQWAYTDSVGKNNHGLPILSSMYKNLRTNLPREIMGFPGLPMTEGDSSFVSHKEVQKYLIRYATHYDLFPYIKLNHLVEMVEPVLQNSGPPSWKITVKNLTENNTSVTVCDFLMICCGHYGIPNIPDIPGICNYSGQVLHSHDYREPSPYKGKTVVTQGCGPSGLDLAIEISSVADKVYLCHNTENFPYNSEKFPKNLIISPNIKEASRLGFTLTDGSFISSDTLIFCTGYNYSFPFLNEDCGISIKNNTVLPLYQHLIHTEFPSMAFPGIPLIVLPFPCFDVQISYVMKFFTGKVKFPSKKEIERHWEKVHETRRSMNFPLKYYHKLAGPLQWRYFKELQNEAELEYLPNFIEGIYTYIHSFRHESFTKFRELEFNVLDDNTFVAKNGDATEVVNVNAHRLTGE